MRNQVLTPLNHFLPLAGFRSRDLLSAAFAFAVSLAVYVFTLAPTVAFGDSGELMTAAYTLGVAHPPGYPLWLLLAKFFSLIPIGSIAYRINLMSALLDAGAVATLTLVILRTLASVCTRIVSREKFDSPVGGLIAGSAAATAALTLAFTPTFWHQSVIGEVYALNNFIVCLLLLLLALWGEAPEKSGLLLAVSFLFGAGQANHQTLLLMAPAIALYVVIVRPRILLSPRVLFGFLALFFLGLCLYLYLPIRAAAQPPLNWGDPVTWETFWFHLMRKQYRVITVVRPLAVFMPQVKFFFASIPEESFPIILFVPALFTLWLADKGGRMWLLFNLVAFFCTGVIFIVIANTELDLNAQDILKIYFLPAYIIAALFVGYGVGVIGFLLLRASRRLRPQLIPAAVVALLWFLMPARNFSMNYEKASMRGRDSALAYGELLVNGMQQGGVLFAGTDSAYAIPMYLKWVKGRRSDVSILSFNRLAYDNYAAEMNRNAPDLGLFTADDYSEAVSAILPNAQPDAGDVHGFRNIANINGYLTWKLLQRTAPQKPMYYDQGMHVGFLLDFAIPSGLVMELRPARMESMPADVVVSDFEYWNMLEKRFLKNIRFVTDIDARQKFSKCRVNIGALYLHYKMYDEAEAALDQAIRFSDRNMEAYAYLALMRREQGSREEAIQIFEEYMRRDPWNTSAREFARWLKESK